MSATAPEVVRVERLDDGAVWRVRIGGARGNVLDANAIAALTRLFEEAAREPALKAICLSGEGDHFSFGASVPEHLPGPVNEMLPSFHRMLRALFDCAVFVHAAVRGRCLGGGLELASATHRIAAAPNALLGQPEILLGVFAPAGSLLLRERVGRPRAEDLCLTGRTVDAKEALAIGLVDQIADDPEEAALAWVRTHLLLRSASSLRFANRAARHSLRQRLDDELSALEALYLEGLMSTADAEEGLRAFLDKRAPAWRNA